MSEITHQIKIHCMDLLQAQVTGTIDAGADYLTDLANNTNLPNDRKLYQETMHDLSFERKKMIDTFLQSMDHAFDDLTGSPGSSQFNHTGGIDTSNLQGISDLEEKLSLETMINKSQSRTDLAMQSIVRSLNALMGDDWVQNHQNPLDPVAIVKSWLAAVNAIKLSTQGNLALYGLFDSEMLEVLPKMYEKIGTYLEELPLRGQKKTVPPTMNNSNATSDYEQAFGDIDEPSIMPDFTQSNFSEVADPQSKNDDSNQYDSEPQAERRTEELIRLLDRLQRKRDIDDSEFYGSSYLLDLKALLISFNAVPEGEINPWTIGQINDDVIDMTTLLFSFIMDDAHLPEDIRLQISRLQIPYLKLGLQDKSIFSNKTHPARQLLSDLSQSISLWDPTHTGGLDKLLSRTTSVIDEILEKYSMDTEIFSQYQTSFSNFLSGDEHVDENMQQRQKDTASKTEKADNARLYIESTLDQICENKRIPPIINQILEEFWSKVLFLEFLKSGQNSDDFADFIETTKILVDSVQAKKSTEARQHMAKQLPVLIKRLKDGFTTISVAAYETVDIFRELQECHMLVLKERAEDVDEDEFEVSDLEYEDFKHSQDTALEWNRSDLENALLEESIERSLSRNDSDAYAFEENNNIISSKQDLVRDASLTKAARERNLIDNELKEARDAYEQALKEHQEKKSLEATENDDNDGDDFMAQFFQDPEFIQKQYEGNRDLSASDDLHIKDASDELIIEDDIFEELQQTTYIKQPQPYEVEFEPEIQPQTLEEMSDNSDFAVGDSESRAHSNDDLAGRAHGALEDDFDILGDDQVSELIGRLKVGLWVDLIHADGNKVRAKIMAIVPTVGKYILGDRAGRKLADYNKTNLAEALREGKIRVSEEDNVFDKTLESVIANLRVMKKAEDD